MTSRRVSSTSRRVIRTRGRAPRPGRARHGAHRPFSGECLLLVCCIGRRPSSTYTDVSRTSRTHTSLPETGELRLLGPLESDGTDALVRCASSWEHCTVPWQRRISPTCQLRACGRLVLERVLSVGVHQIRYRAHVVYVRVARSNFRPPFIFYPYCKIMCALSLRIHNQATLDRRSPSSLRVGYTFY